MSDVHDPLLVDTTAPRDYTAVNVSFIPTTSPKPPPRLSVVAGIRAWVKRARRRRSPRVNASAPSWFVFVAKPLFYFLTVFVSAVFATVFLTLNTSYSFAVILLRPVFGWPWLGWHHEVTILGMLLRMEFRRAEFYRTHAKALDKLAGKSSTGCSPLKEREKDKLLKEIVQAQIDAVAEQIKSGEDIIKTKDTMSLSSVVVATVFFAAYLVYFWNKDWVTGDVNSKVFDALAIVLPWMLKEEMAIGLSQVLLWYKWTPFPIDMSFFRCVFKHHKRRGGVFEAQMNKLCKSVGVGAPDMAGFTEFICSLWTLFFLIQGYTVERYSGDGDVKGELANHIWLTNVYWWIHNYSALMVLYCYFPFVCAIYKAEMKDLESVGATCRTYLFLKRMGKTQTYLRTHDQSETTTPTAAPLDKFHLLRRLRFHTLLQVSDDALISHTLYVVALSTFDYTTGQVNGQTIGNLAPPTDDGEDAPIETWSPIVKSQDQQFWARHIESADGPDQLANEFPVFLLRLPKLNGEYVESTEPCMTLLSMPVMDTYMTAAMTETVTLGDVLVERNITSMDVIFNCSIVQEKKIYFAPKHKHLTCIALEVQLMKNYTVTIFIAAEVGAAFGTGSVYVQAKESPSYVRLHNPSPTVTGDVAFVQVVDEDELRAFASCSLNIDPASRRELMHRDLPEHISI
ncbi:Aste57867_23566 [Aphanomyces stellatus]|uniref:Aste57867_23566 protein n=1 Tax=Aphanomyces stellatus TaxID=120398 RepID=A0A485LMZ9_9STRA|nr:hypothetical protein As57867_023495 [Aphanomyces stellatus]VFU00211.1 Aste57867_23566 [Aphanomyces stellatus]